MQCRGDEQKGCHTCHGAQRAELGVGALLRDTPAMPGILTSIHNLLTTIDSHDFQMVCVPVSSIP